MPRDGSGVTSRSHTSHAGTVCAPVTRLVFLFGSTNRLQCNTLHYSSCYSTSFIYVFLLIFMRNMLASIIDACINERLTFCARILIKLPRVHKVRHSSLIVFSLALDWYLFIVGKDEPWPFISKHKTMYMILWSISGLNTFSLRVFYIFT